MNVMVIVNHLSKILILFQNVKENYFISILYLTSPLPEKNLLKLVQNLNLMSMVDIYKKRYFDKKY